MFFIVMQQFFTSDHIYGNPTAKGVYSASAFDPEGLLGSLASIFQVWIGYQAGYILQVRPVTHNTDTEMIINISAPGLLWSHSQSHALAGLGCSDRRASSYSLFWITK